MDPAIRSHARAWLICLSAVLVSAGILIPAGDESFSPRASQVVDLSASRPGSISELFKSKDWMSQVRFFNDTYFGPESSDWRNPPASQVVPQSVAQLQQQPKDDRLVTLRISGPVEDMASDNYTLQVRSRALSRDLKLPTDVSVGPMLRDSGSVSFDVVAPGFFGPSSVTSEASTAPATLEYERAMSLDLPVDPSARRSMGQDHLHLRLQLMKFDPDQPTFEATFKTAARSSEIPSNVITGSLSFNDLNVTHELLFPPSGRYTTLIITGDKDLSSHVRCTRTDNGQQVGAYSNRVPMMAVAVNAWASIKVRISVHQFDETMHYRIVSLSADDTTMKALLLWFVAHDLTSKEIEGRVLSLPEIDARAAWLKDAFGVQFTQQEAENAQDLNVKRLLDHLRNAQ